MFRLNVNPRRNRPRVNWYVLRGTVLARDVEVVRRKLVEVGLAPPTLSDAMVALVACPAWVMDPALWATCWGTWNLDHVKDESRLGVKAGDDEDHLVALCAAHDERGMKAGHQWNTANRAAEREYLAARRAERGR